MVPDKQRGVSLLQASTVIFLLLVCAKLLNFVKKIMVGNFFGVSGVADAFFAASYLPYYLAIFFEGVIFLGFLPMFSRIKAEKGEEAAGGFVSQILVLVFITTGLLSLAVWWQAGAVMGQIVPGFKHAEMVLSVDLFKIMALVLVLISLTSFFKALNSFYGDYGYAASSGLVDAGIMITVILFCWKNGGIYSAAWGAVAGAFAAMITQGFWFFRRHLKFSAGKIFASGGSLELILFFIPIGMIWFFQQIPFVILNRFGSGMWAGTISALTIAYTMTTVPTGLVSHTVLFAIFPSFAKQAGENEIENLRDTFFGTLRGGFLILIPAGFLLTALASPLAVVFFEGGGITAEGTRRVANSLICFGWATFALYADLFMAQSLISVRKAWPAIILCASRAVLTYGIGYFLSTYWDYQGLALSFSLAMVINFVFLFPLILRSSPFRGRWKALLGMTLKAFAASLPIVAMGIAVNRYPILSWLKLSKTASCLVIAGVATVGCAAYFYILYGLKVTELRAVAGRLKQGWIRKDWTFAEDYV